MDSKGQLKLDVVVPAAGVGRRMGAAVPKQYLKLQGQTILELTLAKLLACSCVSQVIVALSQEDPYFDTLEISKDPRIIRTAGGAERPDSVLAGLYLAHSPWVLVHDAVRPLVSPADIEKLVTACVQADCGGILAAPAVDSLKLVQPKGSAGDEAQLLIERNLPRDLIFRALTPQCFKREQLTLALHSALQQGMPVTDEASAMEQAGYPCQIVPGRTDNFKITTKEDLQLAAALLGNICPA